MKGNESNILLIRWGEFYLYKFLFFHGRTHESLGGMDDLVLKFNTFEEFKNSYEYSLWHDWFQLVRTDNFSYKEFSSKIIWRVGIDDSDDITKARNKELLEWVDTEIREALK